MSFISIPGYDHKSKLKRSGIIVGFITALCMFVFFFWASWYGERAVTLGGILMPIVLSLPFFLLALISVYAPIGTGWVFILIGAFWIIITAVMMFNTITPWTTLLQGTLSLLPLASGILLVKSASLRNEE